MGKAIKPTLQKLQSKPALWVCTKLDKGVQVNVPYISYPNGKVQYGFDKDQTIGSFNPIQDSNGFATSYISSHVMDKDLFKTLKSKLTFIGYL